MKKINDYILTGATALLMSVAVYNVIPAMNEKTPKTKTYLFLGSVIFGTVLGIYADRKDKNSPKNIERNKLEKIIEEK